ncbi:RNA polymerase sigma factor [Microbacterium sp. 22179]|uniref:RNA polymerase sigma factor n=1 Tax=Microbacterium sp. 22179 TaxID=3453886 RepID=UPI003F82B3E8
MARSTDPRSGDLTVVSDRVLVHRSVDGDASAFREIVRRYAGSMRAYVSRIVGSLSEADDVVQNALVTAWRQLDSLRDPDAVKSWLMRIASREAFAFIRRRPTDATLTGYDAPHTESTQPEQIAIRNAQLAALSKALDTLPEDQRRCWLLRQVAELSYTEIAEEMETSPSTVRGLLSRARSSITIQMGGWR